MDSAPLPHQPEPTLAPKETAINMPAGITLAWNKVSYTITAQDKKEKTLLQNVSGQLEPRSVVAIMGASGAGKSTLLNVLAGRIGPGRLEGSVTVNGLPRDPSTWKQTVAYVEQDDLMFENLTVRETLEYAALLRLPSSMTREQKWNRVDQVIRELGLAKCENTRIGSPDVRGISGGERKRVSIGIELVTQPRLIFLDEPTSGLDAFTASTIVQTVKDIAIRDHCTVLMTIHQPREYILSLFDKLILLSAGKLVYVGDVPGALIHFEKCGFPCPPKTNPSDFFLDTMTIDFRSTELKELSMQRVQRLQDAWTTPTEVVPPVDTSSPSPSKLGRKWPNRPWYELWVLLGRNFKDILRDKASLGATIGQSIINLLILGFVFWQVDNSYAGIQNRTGLLFFICIQLTFGNAMPTIAVFTLQKMIIKRERAAGTYRASSAYLAKIMSQLPLVLFATSLFVFPVYWMTGLANTWQQYLTFACILFLHAVVATLLGIMISSGVPNVRVGQILGPLTVVIFLVFGGPLVNLDTTPVVFRWIKYISIIYYSNSALVQNEFKSLTFKCREDQARLDPTCVIQGETVIHDLGLDAFDSLWWNVLINAAIGLFFTVTGYFLFRWRSQPLMKLK